MLVSFHFPISDFREFSSTKQYTPYANPWMPIPRVDAFQKNLGKLTRRPLGGFPGWIGEDIVCEIKSSLRVKLSDLRWKKRIDVAFRRFYFDGLATCHFTIGFSSRRQHTRFLFRKDIPTLVGSLVKAKIRSKHRTKIYTTLSVGQLVGDIYASGTTQHESVKNYDEIPGIESGTPLAIVSFNVLELSNNTFTESHTIKKELRMIAKNIGPHGEVFNLGGLFCCIAWMDDLPIVLLLAEKKVSIHDMRFTRVAVARMYCEMFIFEKLLGLISSSSTENTDEEVRELLGIALNRTRSRLLGKDKPIFPTSNKAYNVIYDMFHKSYKPGRVDEIERGLKVISARPNLYNAILHALQNNADNLCGANVSIETLNLGPGVMSKQNNQTIILGNNTETGKINQVQAVASDNSTANVGSEIDKSLEGEIEKLAQAIQNQEGDFEIDKIILRKAQNSFSSTPHDSVDLIKRLSSEAISLAKSLGLNLLERYFAG